MPALLRIAVFIFTSLIAIPLRFHPIQPGLDPSWAFALNWFNSRGLLHGRDIGFTWGPLAHLAIAMDIGSGLAMAATAQLAGWAAFVAAWSWIVFVRRVALWRLTGFALATYAGVRFFHIFGYAGFDFFLSWLVLLLLGCSLAAQRWYVPYAAAVAIAALLALMKFSTGIAAASAVLTFPLAARSLQGSLIAGLGLPIAFTAGFLLHNSSFSGLWRYLRTGYELSSEHSTILSLGGGLQTLYIALVLLACYTAVTLLLFRTRNPAFPLAFSMAGPLFLEFKHSFIREPGHVEMLFLFLPLAGGVLVLFVEAAGRVRRVLIAIALVFVSTWLYFESPGGAAMAGAKALREMVAWTTLRQRLAHQTAANLAVDILPQEVLTRIGEKPVSIFPWESSYAAANKLDYRPFPVFQSYDAYTPFLDGWNAEFLESSAPPDFILFNWSSIDDRHPLLDVPQTATALYRNYAFDGAFGGHILLRRLAMPRFNSPPRKIASGVMPIGDKLTLPQSSGSLVLRLFANWNTAGALKKFLWRLPEIRWIGMYGDGSSTAARVPPAVLAGGVPLDLIPADARSFQALYSGESPRKLESLAIVGEGAKYLISPARYEIWEIADLPAAAVAPPNVTVIPGLRGDCKIDVINSTGVTGRHDVVSIDAPAGFVRIRGWAVSSERDVVLMIGGKAYRAAYGFPRADVAAIYGNPRLLHSGFELSVPSSALGSEVHEVRTLVRGVSTGYQSCVDTLRFRLN